MYVPLGFQNIQGDNIKSATGYALDKVFAVLAQIGAFLYFVYQMFHSSII